MKIMIESDNLILRDVEFGDYEQFLEWECDPEMTRYFSYDKGRTYEDVVTEAFAFKYDDSVIDLTITDKSTGCALGRVIISRIDRHHRSLDITKIYVGGDNRDRGIGGETLKALIKYSFEELNMERVTLDYYTANVRAAELYRRLGFRDEGRARHACIKDGEFFDLNIMSILREEYYAKTT